GDQRGPSAQLGGESSAVGHGSGTLRLGRAEVQDMPPARVGGDEVSAPRLDGAERPEVAQPDIECAVTTRGESDQRAAVTPRNRVETVIDTARQVMADRARPVLVRG